METLATCSNASFCFVEIGRVGCFSPLAHVFHIHGPAEQAEKVDNKASSHFSYSGINNGKRTCCSLEVAFPELQNFYVQIK